MARVYRGSDLSVRATWNLRIRKIPTNTAVQQSDNHSTNNDKVPRDSFAVSRTAPKKNVLRTDKALEDLPGGSCATAFRCGGKRIKRRAPALDKPWFYFNERPQPATERSAVSTLYGAPLVRHWSGITSIYAHKVRRQGWKRKRSLVVLAARTNWGLNDDGEARKANFRYHRISVFAGIDGINKTGAIGYVGRGPIGNFANVCVPHTGLSIRCRESTRCDRMAREIHCASKNYFFRNGVIDLAFVNFHSSL